MPYGLQYYPCDCEKFRKGFYNLDTTLFLDEGVIYCSRCLDGNNLDKSKLQMVKVKIEIKE